MLHFMYNKICTLFSLGFHALLNFAPNNYFLVFPTAFFNVFCNLA